MTCKNKQVIIRYMKPLIHLIDSAPWLITAEWLEMIRTIAQRENEYHSVLMRGGEPLQYTRTVTYRDGVAIIPIEGAIFPKANLMTEISGATSVEVLAKDISAAVDNPEVNGIVLLVDSPGGHVTGISELASHIRAYAKQKRIIAYVGGMAASAAYWLSSAVKKGDIVVDKTAQLGSIGVVATYVDSRKMKEGLGVVEHEIVSSQSPNKRPDPATEDGRSQIQQNVDDLADVFVRDVARNRGVSIDTVLNRFGGGGILTGAKAVEAGLADRLGSLESVISELSPSQSKQTQNRSHSMDYQAMKTALGLPEDAGDDAVAEAVGNLIAKSAKASSAIETMQANLKAQDEKIAAILADKQSTAAPAATTKGNDVLPDQSVLMEQKEIIAKLTEKLEAQERDAKARELESLIAEAQASGKLVSQAEVTWAKRMGAQNIDGLKEYLAACTPMRAFAASQTGGVHEYDEDSGLTIAQSTIARQMGLDADAFKKSAQQVRSKNNLLMGG
jgi:signal peptide peptidase SppA